MPDGPPSILAVAEVFPPRMGGSGRWLWELYRRLPAGWVHVAAGAADGDGEFDRTHAMPVSRLPLRFSSWGLLHWASSLEYRRAAARLTAIAADVSPEVIHCGKAMPEGLLGWWVGKRRGVPFWCYVHGEELMLAHTSRELRWTTAWVLSRAARLVANSAHTRRMLQDAWHIPSERILVMHPGVDTTRFVPAARDAHARAQLGWADRPVVLTVGALQKRKGQDMLIRALPALRERFPSILYCVAGEGWERDELQALTRDLGVEDAVQFRGVASESELVACYQQCDLFALPNRRVGWDFEGFGIVLLEAQACGRPVVTGTSGGTGEAIDHGRSGLAVDCSCPEPLVEAVSQLLADRAGAESMGTCGRAWVCARFDWAVAARAAQDAFRGIPQGDVHARRA